MNIDYAVVGAGPAGLMAARTILKLSDRAATVALFDRGRGPGGRLASRNLGMGRGVVEMGAGRFSPAEHGRVAALTNEFGLATKPFEYELSPLQFGLHEQNRAILSNLFADLGDAYQERSERERQRMSLKEACTEYLGNNKFEYIVEMCGYDTLQHADLSFEEGFQLVRHHPETSALFPDNDQTWLAFSDGFSSLIDAMYAQLASQMTSCFNHELVSIRALPSDEGYELSFDTPGGRRAVRAGKLVLAMPAWANRSIEGLSLSRTIRDRIRPVPLLKAYFAYEEPWWLGLGVGGRCFSTSSLFRKVYFPNDGSRFLMIYCDGDSATKLNEAFNEDHALHDAFVAVIRDALPFATDPDDIPRPIDANHCLWPHGISFWRGGMNLVPAGFWQIGDRACICSDLFTEQMGWVEGAIASAEAAAQHLCLGVPNMRAA